MAASSIERRRSSRAGIRRMGEESLYLKKKVCWRSKKAKDGHRNASNRSNQIHTNSSRTCSIHIGFWSNWIGITGDYGWNSLLSLHQQHHIHLHTSCVHSLLWATMHHPLLFFLFPLQVLFVRESRNLKGCWVNVWIRCEAYMVGWSSCGVWRRKFSISTTNTKKEQRTKIVIFLQQ